MPRVSFFIDGFNVYHSIEEALAHGKIRAGKWLDYRRLCEHYLPMLGPDATLAQVYYFSALATFLSHDVTARHRTLIKALEHTGVNVTLGNFKIKKKKCRATCRQLFDMAEEKESDVNIAISLLESFMIKECDIGVIVTGDTDLVSAVKAAKRMFPANTVTILFPYKRSNTHYKAVADSTHKIPPERYEQYQLPLSITLADGTVLSKPSSW